MATTPMESLGDDDADDGHGVSSSLDDSTHDELRMLYEESTATLRFVKHHQWNTVGATLLAFFGLVAIAAMADAGREMASMLMGITIVFGAAVIFTLIIYQFWMHNEMSKIDAMEPHFSDLFRDVRAMKSKREGAIHRYTLLLFMFGVIVLGGLIVYMALARIGGL